jgi:hypothetical protein
MSKKSRKRNKKILAAIGIGLGAAALAKNKRDKSIDSGIEAANADKGSDMLSKTVTPKKKPDSKMPSNLSKDTGKDNKPVKKTRIKPFRSLDLGIPEGSKPLKLTDNSIRNKNRDTNAAGIKEPNKPMIASIFPKSKTADNYAGDMRDFQKTNYKSGGRVKGCGKALRGFGKAMKGKK